MTLKDEAARRQITTATGSTLFVNAGAGSGKTSALVKRVYAMVMEGGVSLQNIAAVTFTEKAGAELRDRLRSEFEKARRNGKMKVAADQALDELDSAAIGTLHSFAQRLLSEHPIDAGLPPLVEVLDEVGSSIAFERRWIDIQRELLDDDTMATPLLLAMAAGLQLKRLRSLLQALGRDWDLIEERILAAPPPTLDFFDWTTFRNEAHDVLALRDECRNPADKLLPAFEELAELLTEFDHAPDDETRLTVVKKIGSFKIGNGGARANWDDVNYVKDELKGLRISADALVGEILDFCLRLLTPWLARRVLGLAQERRREGRLEFHDLLVTSRDLLRNQPQVRAALHDKYRRILLDEFQDTDPIQIELAVRIAAGEAADSPEWEKVDVPPGRLFVVGDAKQSIYRFRRASIETYLRAQNHIGQPVSLTTNFRTVPAVLEWVNAVFGTLIQEEERQQPKYEALDDYRKPGGSGAPLTVLGAQAHEGKVLAAELRDYEATDVAAIIRKIIDEQWQVFDEVTRSWRPARLADIVILVPARTSLPFLEQALGEAQVPYRAEASSLVYHASEVRALLACARAIADTTDELSLVTALRSPLFGCGDDDLWRWKQAGGRFTVYSTVESELERGPVGKALTYLRRFHFDSRWMTPSEVLSAIVTDRRMFEVAASERRARDSWRRLRFIVDQARAWSEVSHGGLRDYLTWAEHQGTEVGRVAESVLPETDVEAVRVMTIHAAKGLEFPIVIMSGMTARANSQRGVQLLWPAEGGYSVSVGGGIKTVDFDDVAPIDEQMDAQEKLRLLYVAATRARDHLIVSLHRGTTGSTAAHLVAEAGGATTAGAVHFSGYDFTLARDAVEHIVEPPDWDEWFAGVSEAQRRSRAKSTITASGLEGTEPEIVLDDEAEAGSAKGPRDIELLPWSKGRYGSAIGRAVHAVLQSVDLRTGDGIDQAVAAQAVAEGVLGHEPLIKDLVKSALASDIVKRAAAGEHWREMYVGTVRKDGNALEGFIDLTFRDHDGSLHVVDYKTDNVTAGGIPSRVTYYKPQMDAYAEALSTAAETDVKTTLLFLHPNAAVSVPVTR
ncbi:UvrD-helicase domain-containing protein [Smaragdicoccus niigatensis]|uniref:UvrD-helicase domain-containing protein n=1 Tax=Smaragdicoccus niigatensis TaxID=359359 RepID=UPI00036AB872|nr:UvrD-helicase domain-containing protein [Smaragdicoccus niigatensis]